MGTKDIRKMVHYGTFITITKQNTSYWYSEPIRQMVVKGERRLLIISRKLVLLLTDFIVYSFEVKVTQVMTH